MGKYPHGLANKYKELMTQLRAPPGTDLKRLPYPLMLKDKVKDRGSEIEQRSCMTELNMVFHCFSTHEFDQSKCTKETEALMACFNESVKDLEKRKADSRGELKEGQTALAKHAKLTAKQVNSLLKKNPHPFPDDGKKYRK